MTQTKPKLEDFVAREFFGIRRKSFDKLAFGQPIEDPKKLELKWTTELGTTKVLGREKFHAKLHPIFNNNMFYLFSEFKGQPSHYKSKLLGFNTENGNLEWEIKGTHHFPIYLFENRIFLQHEKGIGGYNSVTGKLETEIELPSRNPLGINEDGILLAGVAGLRDRIYGVDLKTSKILWEKEKLDFSAVTDTNQLFHPKGIVFAPLYRIKKLSKPKPYMTEYTFSHIDHEEKYYFAALDINTGEEIWRSKKKIDEFLVGDDLVYLILGNKMIASDVKTGKKAWKTKFEGTPYIGNNLICIDTGEKIKTLDAKTGKERWEHRIEFPNPHNEVITFSEDEIHIYTRSVEEGWHYFRILDSETGEEKHTIKLGRDSLPCAAGNYLYYNSKHKKVICYDLRTRQEEAEIEVKIPEDRKMNPPHVMGSPFVNNKQLYVFATTAQYRGSERIHALAEKRAQ